MNVLAFALRKGGSGKSTLAAHLALHAHRGLRRCLLVDEDPQGSLTLWNALRQEAALPIKAVKRELADVLKKAKRRDVDWVFIDTPATVSASVVDAIHAARLVIIPCRPGLLDIDAVLCLGVGYERFGACRAGAMTTSFMVALPCRRLETQRKRVIPTVLW
jgi:cellulose biosynthesis protein BcsQ